MAHPLKLAEAWLHHPNPNPPPPFKILYPMPCDASAVHTNALYMPEQQLLTVVSGK